MNPTRRWLVPAAALGAMLGPVLVGGCFDLPPFLEDCEACADCYAALFDDAPLDLPDLPVPPDPAAVPPPPDPADAGGSQMGGSPGGSPAAADTDAEAEAAGPRLRERPRVPDAVLRPLPDAGERNVPSPGYSPPN